LAVPVRALSILLIEVDADWRELLADALFASGHSVHQVADCRRGTELARALSPHVILLGRTADGTDLLEACWTLRSVSLAALLVIRRRPADPGDCLVLEMGGTPGDVELLSLPQVVGRARMAWQPHRFDGASGRTLPRGLDQETAGSVRVDRVTRRAHVGDEELPLTPREFDLLSFLLANQGRVLSPATILAHVWTRRPTAQSLKTVAVHVRWLRHKLEVQQDLTIVTVRGAGYRLDVHPADDPRPAVSEPVAETRLSKRTTGPA
jgi:DNA-binding response OmpR family regulator